MSERVDVEEIARRLGVPVEEVHRLVSAGVLVVDANGLLDPGDIHRVRLLSGFEDAGVPLDALIAADRAGRISLRYYDQLHAPPALLSGRTYQQFVAILGERATHLPALFAAFGLAEPAASTALDVETETLLEQMLGIVEATGTSDLALRAIRLWGEGARRSADGALAVYGDAVQRYGGDTAALPADEVFSGPPRTVGSTRPVCRAAGIVAREPPPDPRDRRVQRDPERADPGGRRLRGAPSGSAARDRVRRPDGVHAANPGTRR
ncbi:MAG TPA: hypothetical protein VFV72_01875 [Candidatus Limnocylindrales bacterium]|nr:hypothetical protein [Candidatus Limnocylindrales bacterium]